MSLVDLPNKERNVHALPTPRVGGIPIFISFLLPLIWFIWILDRPPWLQDLNLTRYFFLIFLIFLLGLADDIWSLRASIKITVQLLVAATFAVWFAPIIKVNNPIMNGLMYLGWLSVPATILWIVGITNAFNLIDGIDGLASGSALFTALTMMYVAITNENYHLVTILCAISGAIFGFLPYNFNPATIFLGDCGSLSIGFLLATISILGTQKTTTLVTIFIPILACGFPLLEILLSVARRFLTGKPISGADRRHIHHQLLAKGLSQRQAVLILYGISTLFALCGIFVNNSGSRTFVFVLFAVGVVVWILVRQLGYNEFKANKREGP